MLCNFALLQLQALWHKAWSLRILGHPGHHSTCASNNVRLPTTTNLSSFFPDSLNYSITRVKQHFNCNKTHYYTTRVVPLRGTRKMYRACSTCLLIRARFPSAVPFPVAVRLASADCLPEEANCEAQGSKEPRKGTLAMLSQQVIASRALRRPFRAFLLTYRLRFA